MLKTRNKETATSTLQINEIFFSLQGEAIHTGLPCIFIRLSGCHLRCVWCDTEYAFYQGEPLSLKEIMQKIGDYPANLVQITGGEPLLQKNVYTLFDFLHQKDYKILLETSGAISIANVPNFVHICMDFKAPCSKESHRNLYSNLNYLKNTDELKIIITSHNDFLWAEKMAMKYYDSNKYKYPIILQPAFDRFDLSELSHLIKYSRVPFRLGIQLHKFIYPDVKQGV